MKLFQKLAIGNLVGIAVVGVALYGAVNGINSTRAELDGLMEETLPVTEALHALRQSVLTTSASTGEYLFLGSASKLAGDRVSFEAAMEEEQSQLDDAKYQYFKSWHEYKNLVTEFFPDEAIEMAELKKIGDAFFIHVDNIMHLARQNATSMELIEAKERLESAEMMFLAETDKIVGNEREEIVDRHEEITGTIYDGIIITIVLVLTAFSVIIGASFVFSRSMISRINTLKNATTVIAAGELAQIAPDHSKDELGSLFRGFHAMAEKLRTADQHRRQAESELRQHRDQLQHKVDGATEKLRTKAEELKQALKKEVERTNAMEHLATHDALTGLGNRRHCTDKLSAAINGPEESGGSAVVLHLDLDGFKSVNDTLGHGAGDDVLCQVADRLRKAVRASDTVARVGGDEFVVVCPGHACQWDPEPLAAAILSALSTPFHLVNDARVDVGCSIGISVYPDDDHEAEGLLVAADLALYRAKETGKNRYIRFDPSMRSEFRHKIELAQKARRAIDDGEFEVFYQPQIEIETGRIVGVEALARWRDPELGLRSPGEFLDVLEHSDGMQKLGTFVMERAIADAACWHRDLISFGRIGLNISTVQLGNAEFIDTLLNRLFAHSLPPDRLAIEILEGAVISSHNRRLRALLDELNDLQISVEFDDFGTGYASLNHLRQLPVNRVKIDRSFITDIVENPDHRNIVCGVIDIVRKLGLGVIAEGVETVEQATLLKDWGCPVAQGYLFSRPIPFAEATSYLKLADHKRSLMTIASVPQHDESRVRKLSAAS